jgi:hypothetical protein
MRGAGAGVHAAWLILRKTACLPLREKPIPFKPALHFIPLDISWILKIADLPPILSDTVRAGLSLLSGQAHPLILNFYIGFLIYKALFGKKGGVRPFPEGVS